MTPAQAIAQAQAATQKALSSRHPGTVTLTEPGAPGVAIAGGIHRGAVEWIDSDGVPRRDQGLSFTALKSAFPGSFSASVKGWVMTYEGASYRVRGVLDWGASWLVRGVR